MIPRAPGDQVAPAIPAFPLVVADLEGTCTRGETWRGVGSWLAVHERRGRYRRFLAPRMAVLPFVRFGLISRQGFRDRWIRDLARLLRGLTSDEIDDVATRVVDEELWPRRNLTVVAALETAAAGGARVVLASGTYQPVLEAFAARIAAGPAGPAVALGTPLEMADERATGRLVGRVGTGALKAARVAALAAGAPVVTAYGDSLADVPLLELAAEAVAVAPDGDLRPLAIARGWRIVDDPSGAAG